MSCVKSKVEGSVDFVCKWFTFCPRMCAVATGSTLGEATDDAK